MNVLTVVNEILNRGPITTVAASLVVLTYSRIRHYGGIIIDLVPTAALTVTASSVSSSLSAATKAIVATCSIMIHHHGGIIGDLFLVPTTALTVTASSVSSSLSAPAKAIVKATSIRIHHHGGFIGDLFLVPTTALTVTASSVSFSLSAPAKAIVATCSIMIHRHGICALLLFPTPTLAASSITASTHASPSTARKLHSISFQHCQTRKDKYFVKSSRLFHHVCDSVLCALISVEIGGFAFHKWPIIRMASNEVECIPISALINLSARLLERD
jgi:hypothetical protein